MQAISHGGVSSIYVYTEVLTDLTEQENKENMARNGRASTIWPRTMEILDQLDLAEGLLQIGITTRDSMHFRESVTPSPNVLLLS
jgi:2-polyprenyl-6-methoxyphenol hydroxylase-like FAD-dependent oxidoreductase